MEICDGICANIKWVKPGYLHNNWSWRGSLCFSSCSMFLVWKRSTSASESSLDRVPDRKITARDHFLALEHNWLHKHHF